MAGENTQAQTLARSLPTKLQNLLDIRRQQESKLFVYNSLLAKREESAIAMAATISNIKILEKASPNYYQVKPNRRNAQLIAVFIGLILPGLGIFIAELLNDKVNTRFDIERLTGVTILGEVGHSFSDDTLIVSSNNRSVVAEQFRIL